MSLIGIQDKLVRLLSKVNTPLQFESGVYRNTTLNARYQAPHAGKRGWVATTITAGLVLTELENTTFVQDMEYEEAMSEDDFSSDSESDDGISPAELCIIMAAEEIQRPKQPSISQNNINPLAPRRTINSFNDTECLNNFRFTKAELHELFNALDVPAYLTAIRADGSTGHKFEGEELFLLMLHRLALVKRFFDYEEVYNRTQSELCEGFNLMMRWTDYNYGHLVDDSILPPQGWVGPTGLGRWSSELPAWGAAVSARLLLSLGFVLALLFPVFGVICCFIDGTFQQVHSKLKPQCALLLG